jgi:hypothetical protein
MALNNILIENTLLAIDILFIKAVNKLLLDINPFTTNYTSLI